MFWPRCVTMLRGLSAHPSWRWRLSAGIVVVLTSLSTQTRTGEAALILDDVIVRVYDNTGLPDAVRRAGLTHTAEIFARADVQIGWVHCPARCGRPPGSDHLILRLTRKPLLAVGVSSSMIDQALRAGRLATVYVDQVDAMARRTGTDKALVLSRAVAHELGHLLLGSTEHTSSGLMRGVWSAESLRRNNPEDWQFTPLQGSTLRARIAAGIPPAWNAAVPSPTAGLPGT